jgi:hypothetical protein
MMAEDMRVILRMAKRMVKVPSFGQMETNILEVGEMTNNMASASTIMLKIAQRNRVSGSTAKDTLGLTDNYFYLFKLFIKINSTYN